MATAARVAMGVLTSFYEVFVGAAAIDPRKRCRSDASLALGEREELRIRKLVANSPRHPPLTSGEP